MACAWSASLLTKHRYMLRVRRTDVKYGFILILLRTCRKKLFDAVHYFVHLNLALALCLALVVFVAGVEPAAANEVPLVHSKTSNGLMLILRYVGTY